jgi:glucose-1-phosphate thymidylyltransferase
MRERKGIILCGGSGSRLRPLTNYVTKQFLPIYDKPMIHYPLYTMLKMGIGEILFISTMESTPVLEWNLKDGSEFGAKFRYAVQEKPNGIAQAFVIGDEFIGNSPVCLLLGDNLFYGSQCERVFRDACRSEDNTIFGYQVSDPRRYGVVDFDADGNVLSIEEKPENPKTNYAVPGIYFYGQDVVGIAKSLKPSRRGEYEITDVNREYLKMGKLKFMKIKTGNAWLDTGTFGSLNDASNFIRTIEDRTGLKVCDLEKFRKNR